MKYKAELGTKKKNIIKNSKYCKQVTFNLNKSTAWGCWLDYIVKVIFLCGLSVINQEI